MLEFDDAETLIAICASSVVRPEFYKDEFHYGTAGLLAARLLSKHGWRARLDGDTGRVTLESQK